jgi:hypothetical protein
MQSVRALLRSEGCLSDAMDEVASMSGAYVTQCCKSEPPKVDKAE